MPLDTQTIDLGSELESLKQEREDKASELVDLPDDAPAAAQLAQEGIELDNYINGLGWAVEEYGEINIVVGSVNSGERNLVQDIADDLPGSALSNVYIAVGSRDAPWLEHDPNQLVNQTESIKDTVKETTGFHPSFEDYLEKEIRELESVGSGMGKSFRELVLEKRIQQKSAENNG